MPSTEEIAGRGFSFPFRPSTEGRFRLIGGADVVRQGIEAILSTEPGERVGLPTYGCGLRRYLMEPNTTTTRTLMAFEIDQALRLWEHRIVLGDVSVTPGDDPSMVWIEISYVHRADQSAGNLVYPYYLT